MKSPQAILIAFIALSLLASSAWGATGPSLQVYNYTLIPDPVYAGSLAYLQIGVRNVGDAAATSTQATYTTNGLTTAIPMGDIQEGSSAQVSVPFKALEEAAGSIQQVGVAFDYFYATTASGGPTGSSSTNSRRTSVSIPVPIAQKNPLVVGTRTMGQTLAPGDKVTLEVDMANNGGVVNNVVITAPANSSFSLEGTTQVVVGTIPANQSRRANITLVSSSATAVGAYSVPLVFTYYDRLNRPADLVVSVGPVSVLDSSSRYRLEVETPKTVEVGGQATLRVRLVNRGTQSVSATVDINATEQLTPIGLQRLFFDEVRPGSTETRDVVLGVSATAASGYYTLPLKLTPSIGSPSTQYAGVRVEATPSLIITIDQPGTAQAAVMLANTGNSQIRSAWAVARPKGRPDAVLGQSFIGTLNVDDYATLDLSGATGAVEVEVHFRDSRNQEHTLMQELDLGQGFVMGNATVGGGTRSAPNTGVRAGGPLGGLLGGGRAFGAAGAPAPGGGLPILPIVAGVAVLAVGYGIYRWKFAKKKEGAR